MWTPKTSNKSNSNRVDVNGRTYMTPYSTPFVPSSAASNESGGIRNNIHGSFTPYFPGSYASRSSSTNIVGLPSGIQQTQGGSSSMRNTSHVLTNEPFQLSLGSSHGYSGITKTGGPPLIPNKPPLVPNKGHAGRMVNSIGGFVSADGSGSSSTGLSNVPSPVSCLNLSDIQVMQNIGGPVDYTATQRQKEYLVQPHQYPQYQHLQQSQPQPQPGFYNPLRGKEVAQSSRLRPDDNGLLGLLKIIKGANPAKTSLAMGVDPHSLGLDLNSLEPLHQKFASPFSDEPVKEGPKYDIPDCYNSQQPPPLKLSHFKNFHIAMLFYIFYSMPQDQAQLFAANELHNRGWCFHRELRMWFMRDSLPAAKNSTYEVGSYICFDPYAWQTIRQENVVLHYEMIEQRPVIPP